MTVPLPRLRYNLTALYAWHVLGFLLSLLLLPYLSRVLGPAPFGVVALAQAVAVGVSLLVEYGFNLSAARSVARARDDPAALAQIASGVLGAKLALAGAAACIALVLYALVPDLHASPAVFALAFVWATAQAFSVVWFLQGLERARTFASIDLAGRAVALALTLLLVKAPSDAWLYVAVQAGVTLASTLAGMVVVHRLVRFLAPDWRRTRAALAEGWHTFLLRASQSLRAPVNVFVVGVLAAGPAVGLYAGSERIVRAAVSGVYPVGQAFYPRISSALHRDIREGARFARLAFAINAGISLLATLSLLVLAPFVVRVILGPEFEGSVPLLRILAVLPVLSAANEVLGVNWLLPLGRERTYYVLSLVSVVVNVALAFGLGLLAGATGVAWAFVAAEATLLVLVVLSLLRLKANPFEPTGLDAGAMRG